MEGKLKIECVREKRVLAKVVRQFAPSRIERQTLAKAFELAWCPVKKWDSSSTSNRAAVSEVAGMGRNCETQEMQGVPR